MKKSDLVNTVKLTSGLKEESANRVVNAIISDILSALAEGESVNIVGFGTFTSVLKAEAKCRDPRSGEGVVVPAHLHPKFSFAESVRLAFRDGNQSKFIKSKQEDAQDGNNRRKDSESI